MAYKTLPKLMKIRYKRSEPEGVGAPHPTLDIGTYTGGPDMPVDRHYTDSPMVGNQEHLGNVRGWCA